MVAPELIALLLLATSSVGAAEALQTSFLPVRESYHLGEPIGIQLSLMNTGPGEVSIDFEYPDWIGTRFSCKNPDAVAVPGPADVDRPVRLLHLKPGQEYTRVIALNRYLTFKKPKRYAVQFSAHFLQRGDVGFSATPLVKGEFAIDVLPGPVDKRRLGEHINAMASKDVLRVEDAVEMLLWAEDPIVIAPLEKAAKQVSRLGNDIVRALAKFFPDERAKSAILVVAIHGNANALMAALAVYEAHKVNVPTKFTETVLSSGYGSKTYYMLAYLVKCGGPDEASLVEPFRQDKNPLRRKLAEEFLTRLGRGQPPQPAKGGAAK